MTNVSAELSSLASTRAAAATPEARDERRRPSAARSAARSAAARERARRGAAADGAADGDVYENTAGRVGFPDPSAPAAAAAGADANGGIAAADPDDGGKEGDEDPDAAASLVAHAALQELAGLVQAAARDGVGSRVLEQLLDATDAADVVNEVAVSLLAAGGARAAGLAKHRCGPHVVQPLLGRLTSDAAAAGPTAPPSPGLAAALGWLDALPAAGVVGLMADARGSHVFRAAVTGLAGVPPSPPRSSAVDAGAPLTAEAAASSYITEAAWPMPEAAGAAVVRLAGVLVDDLPAGVSLDCLAREPATSAALQALLARTFVWDAPVVTRLDTATLGGDGCLGTWGLATDMAGSRLVESAVLAFCGQPGAGAPGTVVGDIAAALLPRLAAAVAHPTANYVLAATLPQALTSRGAVASALDALDEGDAFATAAGLASGREGVVLSLGRAAAAHGDAGVRARFTKALARALGAVGADAKHLTPALIVDSLPRLTRWRAAVSA